MIRSVDVWQVEIERINDSHEQRTILYFFFFFCKLSGEYYSNISTHIRIIENKDAIFRIGHTIIQIYGCSSFDDNDDEIF